MKKKNAAEKKIKRLKQKTDKVRVLVLEGDGEDRWLIQRLLKEVRAPQFDVAFMSTLREGLERLRQWNGDVIFSDLQLPDSHGLDTFKKIRSQTRKIPIVLLSRLEDEKLATEAVRSGAQDYLVKAKLNSNMLSRVLRYAIERKKAEEEIYKAEERYRTIFENSAVAIILVDQSERIVSWNKCTEYLLDYGKQDLYLKQASMIFAQEAWQKVKSFSAERHGATKRLEIKALKKSKEPIEVDVSWSILKDVDGTVTGAILILQDITERKRLETLKDEFVSTVSHELRTPMTIIREGVSQVIDGLLGQTTKDQQKVMMITLESIDRLGRIIDDLLDISKLEAGKMEIERLPLDFVELVREVKTLFFPMARDQGIEISLKLSSERIDYQGDRDMLVQVFTNLVGNALKFTKQGRIDIEISDKGKYVECSVADTGCGISAHDLPRVFDKFQQFKRESGPGNRGTGLGLSICKGIVELHQGEIWVESKLGKGAKFVFTLPRQWS
ncbi:MAG: ATP-binding protein [Candidatus Omnitrophica bacterium]|nr:ATP-binding protein [Candidatus Omnitrophota bacterium]MDD5671725.1 ATP-binding protein [Candidatus Omnitrophota bacterium]